MHINVFIHCYPINRRCSCTHGWLCYSIGIFHTSCRQIAVYGLQTVSDQGIAKPILYSVITLFRPIIFPMWWSHRMQLVLNVLYKSSD